MLLVGVDVGCSVGCFWSCPPWWKTASKKAPMTHVRIMHDRRSDSENDELFLKHFREQRKRWHLSGHHSLFCFHGQMVLWFPFLFFLATRRLVLSIYVFTWQSQVNASLIHLIHTNTFTPFTRIVATKCDIMKGVLNLLKLQILSNLQETRMNGWMLLDFPHSGNSLECLKSLHL